VAANATKKEFIDTDSNSIFYWTYEELIAQVKDRATADMLWNSAKEV
jgi:hypothetical protein